MVARLTPGLSPLKFSIFRITKSDMSIYNNVYVRWLEVQMEIKVKLTFLYYSHFGVEPGILESIADFLNYQCHIFFSDVCISAAWVGPFRLTLSQPSPGSSTFLFTLLEWGWGYR